MFEVSVRSRFSAAHHLSGYTGNCSAHHGHNWEVEVYVAGDRLNATGILVDFRQLKEALREALTDLDHKDLNAVPEFRELNPSSEHLARLIYGRMAPRMAELGCRVSRVSVGETPDSKATYWEQ